MRLGAHMRGLLRFAGALVWGGAACLPAWGQAAVAPPDPQAVLGAARKIVHRLAVQEAKAEDNVKAACDKAGVADKELLDSTSQVAAEVKTLAQRATTAQASCDDEKEDRRLLALRSADARTLLRTLALDLPDCSLVAKSCTAVRLGKQILELAKDGTGTLNSILLAASSAQKRVGDQKAAVAEAYTLGDKAAAAALAASAPPASSVEAAETAFGLAAASRRAVSGAQLASNQLVDLALQLKKPCDSEDIKACEDKKKKLQPRAHLAEKTLALSLEDSKMRYENARLASFYVEAGVKFEGPEIERAVRFLRALDDNPDAKSLVGKDSYKITAGKGGAGLAIKINNEKLWSDWFGQTSMTISTPAAKQGNSALYQMADGLSDASQLELARTLFRGESLKSNDNSWALHQSGVSLTVAHRRMDYYELAALDKAVTRTLVPWSLSVFSAWSPLSNVKEEGEPGARANSHYVKLSLQRAPKAADPNITCPVVAPDGSFKPQNVVVCTQGSIGAPKLESSRLFQYEYRYKADKGADFSVSLKHNDVSHITNVDVPIYLLKATDDAKSPIHAGVNFGWSSKGGASFGIFLGAPLSLYMFDR